MTAQHNIQALEREAAEIRWQRFDALIGWRVRSANGNRRAFESVVMAHCKSKSEAKPTKMKDAVQQIVQDAVWECGGNISKAAKKLDVNRSTIYKHVAALFLCASISCLAQRGTVSIPTATTITGPLGLISIPPFKQTVLTWDNPVGASNKVEWGAVRNYWTNGSRTITSNVFFVTNGWTYKVTSIVDGIESIPALWPSNRYDRVIVQTSTNLSTWQDGFIWQTNYNKPQEYLRLRSELIRWE